MPKGRKTKKTPSLEEKLLAALRVGHTDKDACALVGIDPSTLYDWIKADKDDFSHEVEKARLAAKDQSIKTIRRAALVGKQWTAAAWLLERRYPQEYALKHLVTHDGEIKHDLGAEALKRLVGYTDVLPVGDKPASDTPKG